MRRTAKNIQPNLIRLHQLTSDRDRCASRSKYFSPPVSRIMKFTINLFSVPHEWQTDAKVLHSRLYPHHPASTRGMVVIGLLDIPPEIQLQMAEFVEANHALKALAPFVFLSFVDGACSRLPASFLLLCNRVLIPYNCLGPIVWTRILEPSTNSPLFRTFCTVVSFNIKGIEGLVRRIENPQGISTLKPYSARGAETPLTVMKPNFRLSRNFFQRWLD